MDPFDTCEYYWDLISDYADGQAAPDEAALVERHVSDCEGCARALLFMRESALVLADTPEVAPPPGLRNAILAATIYRPTGRQRLAAAMASLLSPPRIRALGGAAATTLLLVITLAQSREPAPRTVFAPPSEVPATVSTAPAPAVKKPSISAPAPRIASETRAAPRTSGTAKHSIRPSAPVVVASRPAAPRVSAPSRVAPRPSHSPLPVARATPRVRPEMVSAPLFAPEPPARTPETNVPTVRTDVARGPSVESEPPARVAREEAAGEDTSRFTLTASAPNYSSAATLAGLRNDLRASRISTAQYSLGDHREVTVDVIRTRF